MHPLILDIRTDEEYCSGHIIGAILVPTPLPPLNKNNLVYLFNFLDNLLKGRSRSSPIYVYCKKGIRAGLALQFLRSMGFTNVISLGGVKTDPLMGLIKKDPIWWKNL